MFYNTDTLFLSEGFLDSCIEACGPDISIPGYNSLRSDHPLNTKRGGVRMFSKHYLLVLRCHDLCVLAEHIITEIKLGKNQHFLLAIIDLQIKSHMDLRTCNKIFT